MEIQWLFESLARGFTPFGVMTLLYEVFGQHVILIFHILIVVFEEVFVILKTKLKPNFSQIMIYSRSEHLYAWIVNKPYVIRLEPLVGIDSDIGELGFNFMALECGHSLLCRVIDRNHHVGVRQ